MNGLKGGTRSCLFSLLHRVVYVELISAPMMAETCYWELGRPRSQ
jgi:hypothetical protein